MSRSLVFATTNRGKVEELERLLGPLWRVHPAADFPQVPEVVEDGDTFEANAAKKAHAFARALGRWTLADDSGLCVDALGGAPGLHSARYAKTASARIDRLLAELAAVAPEARTARFVCAMVLAGPGGEVHSSRGVCEGRIGLVRRGHQGFGYDPVFVLADGRTMAELSIDEMALWSHRADAFRRIIPAIDACVP